MALKMRKNIKYLFLHKGIGYCYIKNENKRNFHYFLRFKKMYAK